MEDGFDDDIYDDKFDLEGDDLNIEIDGITPADSHVLDELVETTEPEDVDVEGLVDVGLSYIEINRYEQAVETFERALRFDDENQDAWVNKGFAHAEMEEFDEATAAYTEAVRIDDSTEEAAKALTNLAYAEYEMGVGGEHLEHIEKALEIDERQPEAWYNRAFFLNEEGRHQDALNSINNAVKLGLRAPYVYEEKARALEGLERYEEAEEAREVAEEAKDEKMTEAMRG
ncbi:tetratricopeptide repeat protein [Halorutilales archaeon Cl-col2-1]